MQELNIPEKLYTYMIEELNSCSKLKDGITKKIKTQISDFEKKLIEYSSVKCGNNHD